ncbi:phage tail protein [Acinetobacter seifertii]|uniref:phage tail protein n=1 Tax=Acinetobacter seifertii TaxID=1530123 RepID=UPI00124EEA3D|nr:phage tail protein [Acinetobacter seifertii]
MKKLESLRTHMLNAVKELQRDPERMLIFTEKGNVRCTLANGLSFEYVYDLNLILTEYAGDLDAVMIPLLDWVRINQHELLSNLEKSKDAFKFETVVLDNGTVDLALTLPLTERVIVKRNDDGTLSVSFPDEPQHEKALPSQLFKMIDSKTGLTLAEWQSAEPEEQYF